MALSAADDVHGIRELEITERRHVFLWAFLKAPLASACMEQIVVYPITLLGVSRFPDLPIAVETEHNNADHTRLIMLAAKPAPKPLSMLTTVTPAAQELSIPNSAAMPWKLAP